MTRHHIKAHNRRQKLKAKERTAKALALLNDGMPVTHVARELGVNRKTLYRNLKKLETEVDSANAEALEQRRERHEAELRTMIDFLLNSPEMSDSEVVGHFRMYQADIAKLVGINKERAGAQVAVQVNEGAGLAFEFLKHSHGISEADMQKVFAFMDSLPREKPVVDASYFPQPELTETTE